jgi:hypothetical protein
MVISDDIIVVCFIFHNMIIEKKNEKFWKLIRLNKMPHEKKRFII